MKIQVNENHILWGEQGVADLCPIALAICEKKFRKKINYICVDQSKIEIGFPDKHFVFEPPIDATEFMDRFDYCEKEDIQKLKPFEFGLNKKNCLEIISAKDEDQDDNIIERRK